MKRARNWLMAIMCLSLVMAITLDWAVFCKIEVAINAVALIMCIVWDLTEKK